MTTNKTTQKSAVPPRLQEWIEARIQMARELGLNPKKLGKLDNHRQEPWKAPLPEFIEHLYLKRFGRTRPDHVMSIEPGIRATEKKKAAGNISASPS